MNKYNIGDKVKIVNYGHWIMSPKKGRYLDLYEKVPVISEDENWFTWDLNPQIVGLTAIVSGASANIPDSYELHIDGMGKSAWFAKDQLELINANPNVNPV